MDTMDGDSLAKAVLLIFFLVSALWSAYEKGAGIEKPPIEDVNDHG